MISQYFQEDKSLVAIAFRYSDLQNGTKFYTDKNLPIQFASMQRSKGEVVKTHTHNKRKSIIENTTEILVIKSGILRIKLLGEDKKFISDVELSSNDIIILYRGYHGISFLEDTIMFEFKQGPYLEQNCKKFIKS